MHCQACGTSNLDTSRFCEECGAKLTPVVEPAVPAYVPPPATDPSFALPSEADNGTFRPVQVTSVGIPPLADVRPVGVVNDGSARAGAMSAKLTLERGDTPGEEFRLSGTESTIGRWDADNGVFPDIDLDHHDLEAKVSRRHARIKLQGGQYMIEDLGSTNGTYVNRGRRLLPGSPQVLNDGDEIIVGKTFLRFHIVL